MKEKIDALFKDNEKMSVYQAARELGVSEYDILIHRPKDEFKVVDGDNFEKIIEDVSTWGEVMFLKNTPNFIIEIKLNIPKGKSARGYYNFDGKSGNLGGHLKADEIDKIGFVSTKFMGMLGHSLHFYDKNKNIIFKIFVNRVKGMKLDSEQERKFLALKEMF